MPEHARAELIARIHQRVMDQGGRVTAHLLAVLTIARRAGSVAEPAVMSRQPGGGQSTRL